MMPQEERNLFSQPKKRAYGLMVFYLIIMIALSVVLIIILPPWLKQLRSFATETANTPNLPTFASVSPAIMEAGLLSDQQKQVASIADVPKQGGWINSEPLNFPALAASGHYVLIYFWSAEVAASNRANRQVEAWWKAYRAHGLVVIGVHTPKYTVDSNPAVVLAAVKAQGLTFPILLDGQGSLAKTFNNYSWPGWQVMDSRGNIILSAKGEGRYADAEWLVRKDLAADGWRMPNTLSTQAALIPSRSSITPDLYLGASFIRRQFGNGLLPPVGKTALFTMPSAQDTDSLYLDGVWKSTADYMENQSPASISVDYFASTVYLTLASASGKPLQVLVVLDGQPVPKTVAGPDLVYIDGQSYMWVSAPRVYMPLLENQAARQHQLTLKVAPRLDVYAFSFARFDNAKGIN